MKTIDEGPKPRLLAAQGQDPPREQPREVCGVPLGLKSKRFESTSLGSLERLSRGVPVPLGSLLRPPPPPPEWVGDGGPRGPHNLVATLSQPWPISGWPYAVASRLPRIPWLATSCGQPSPPRSLRLNAVGRPCRPLTSQAFGSPPGGSFRRRSPAKMPHQILTGVFVYPGGSSSRSSGCGAPWLAIRASLWGGGGERGVGRDRPGSPG